MALLGLLFAIVTGLLVADATGVISLYAGLTFGLVVIACLLLAGLLAPRRRQR